MNPLYEQHELMDKYLNQELSAEEVLAFENKLNTDPIFADQFEIHKITNQIIIGNELLDLKSRMTKDLATQSSWWSKGKYWFIGGLLGLAIILYYLFSSTSSNTTSLPINGPKDTVLSDTVQRQTITPSDSQEVRKGNSEETKTKPDVSCTDSLIKFSCQTRGTCESLKEGAIEIDVKTIKVGQAPFMFSIQKNGEYQTNSSLEGLPSGNYHVFVKDAKNCIRRLDSQVEVTSISCK